MRSNLILAVLALAGSAWTPSVAKAYTLQPPLTMDAALRFWGTGPGLSAPRSPRKNQRKQRLARRRAWAAGDRHAFQPTR